MGANYGSIHIFTVDTGQVRTALEQLSSDLNIKFLLAPPKRGWIAVFPEQHGQDFTVSKRLSEIVDVPLLHCLVYDDDIFCYHYFEKGQIVDQYNSCPGYFSEESTPRGGTVSCLKEILPRLADQAKLNVLLLVERFTFETERFEKAAVIFGLSNAVAAYESLQEGEREGIKNWKKFIHIPDLKPERNAKRAADAKAKTEVKRLSIEGILIAEQIPKQTKLEWWHCVWGMMPLTGEILLSWAPHFNFEPSFNLIDPTTGKQIATPIKLSSAVSIIAISPDNQWLAADYSAGCWKIALVNLETGQRVEIQQKRAVTQVSFAADGKTFFSASQNIITIARGNGWQEIETIPLANYCRTFALHPQGEYLVAEVHGMIEIIHIPTGKTVKLLWIDARPGPNRDLLEWVNRSTLTKPLSAEVLALQAYIKSDSSTDELESRRKQMRSPFLPKQNISAMKFSPDGRMLICGTNEGLCVLNWESVRNSDGMTPLTPQTFVEAVSALPTDEGSVSQYKNTYSICIDPDKQWVLFSGSECKIRFLDLTTGEVGDLLVPPISRTYHHLELTPDRKALVCTAHHHTMKSNERKPPAFQIWSYPALCERTTPGKG